MVGKNIDITTVVDQDRMAAEISEYWRLWDSLRSSKIQEWKELRNFLYATDTKTTSNNLLPWSNTTTTPKLTQIYDNLHANYFAALFPRREWLRWVAMGKGENLEEKKKAVESYMSSKLRASKFEDVASQLLLDYISYGNCFASVEWVNDYSIKDSGYVNHYTGPRVVRISPFDIVFDPTAPSFRETPKVVRSLVTLGEFRRRIDTENDQEYAEAVFSKMMSARAAVNDSGSNTTFNKSEGFVADGFGSIQQYYGSNYVEVLTFYGDIYDQDSGKYLSDRIVTVVDRAYVIQSIENPSWLGSAPIQHAGWRLRPDNLWAMGPLDNLVGLQYRIDHLENLKADVFDQIAYPILKIKGEVEDFEFQPAERIYIGEEGDVGYLAPDTTALNADFQISELERRMEEMSGAPKSAMGIRTPGEKTAFEVSTLNTAANRIFEHRTAHLERVFIEPLLNTMLEAGRRNMINAESVKVFDPEIGLEFFQEVTKADLQQEGILMPLGARHFAERARRVQNINNLYQIKASDPQVGAHISGKRMAQLITEELGEEGLFGENVAIEEQFETLRRQQDLEANMEEELANQQELGV